MEPTSYSPRSTQGRSFQSNGRRVSVSSQYCSASNSKAWRSLLTDDCSSRFPKLVEESIVAPLTSSDNFSDCAICSKIWCGLTGYAANRPLSPIALGSQQEALSSACTRHKPLVEWFLRRCCTGYHAEAVSILFPRPGVLRFQKSIGLWADLLLVRKDPVKNHPGIARIVDPKWVDTSVVDHWRKRCLSSHGRRCENPTKIWHTRPAWVVDTKDACLIPGSECDSYIALSYRWGNAQGLQIQPDTMARLQRPKALDDPEISSQLSPMIRHAIFLTPIIGERYLWVDTLCIDHSRARESTGQLQLMGAIYANASLTIVALDCDAQDGFPGLKSASPHRNLDEPLIRFGKEQFIQDGRYRHMDRDGPYHQRGWTYQEFTMSSRRLILSKGSLKWMCQCGASVEQVHPTVEFVKYTNFDMREIMRGMPDLWSLSYILSRYNHRAFTYDEDALPGISGLLNVFSRCFSGGFLYGIPEMFFEAALSWRPDWEWNRANLRRRIPSDRPDQSRLHPCHLPSWSWIGWEGSVDIGGYEAGPARPRSHWIRETIPITTWYTCDSPIALHKRRIRSSWFENREAYKDFEKPLPPGWTRHTIPEGANREKGKDEDTLPYPDGCGKYIFRHSKMTEDGNEPWHWPFPVPDIDESTQPFMPEQAPYICCETRRARVFAFQADKGNEAILYSSQDKVIGTLSLHNEEQLQRFPRLATGWSAAEEVELAAICRARYYENPWDQQTQRRTLPLKSWEEYTVLWVEWIDGVAYRLACGHVDKAAWEGLALEDVSLILG